MSVNTEAALVVMLKTPAPGLVKTRLVPPLTEAQAAGLYACMVRDTFGRVSLIEGLKIYAAVAGDSVPPAKKLIPAGVESFAQRGADLGARIFNSLKELFDRGYGRVVVIGSDSPDLPDGFIEEAMSALDKAGVGMVLGPATDGGYVLVAMDALRPEPFEGIPWSTGRVLAETIKRAEAAGLGVRLLDAWHDIDTIEDLEILKRNARAPESAAFVERTGI